MTKQVAAMNFIRTRNRPSGLATKRVTTSSFRPHCWKFRERYHNLGLIILNRLQLLTWDGKAENRNHEISEILRELKRTAEKLSCPVIALS